MVKCQRAQYDLISYVICVGVSWWELADRVSFHGVGIVPGAVLSATVGQMLTKSSDLGA